MAAHKRKLQMQLKMIYQEFWKSLLKKLLHGMIYIFVEFVWFLFDTKCIKHMVRRNCILGVYIRSLSNIDSFLINVQYFLFDVFVIVCFLFLALVWRMQNKALRPLKGEIYSGNDGA